MPRFHRATSCRNRKFDDEGDATRLPSQAPSLPEFHSTPAPIDVEIVERRTTLVVSLEAGLGGAAVVVLLLLIWYTRRQNQRKEDDGGGGNAFHKP